MFLFIAKFVIFNKKKIKKDVGWAIYQEKRFIKFYMYLIRIQAEKDVAES